MAAVFPSLLVVGEQVFQLGLAHVIQLGFGCILEREYLCKQLGHLVVFTHGLFRVQGSSSSVYSILTSASVTISFSESSLNLFSASSAEFASISKEL